MRVVVAGAYGFIGRGITRALLGAGHEVIGAGRNIALGRRFFPAIEWIKTDFNEDLDPRLWAGRLSSFAGPVDVVVNAVGILQSDLADKAFDVHGAGARALYEGAREAGVRKIILISATSILHDVDGNDEVCPTEYALSKVEGERFLKASGVTYVIIRPSLVIGPGSTGGALLLRGLAGMPFFTPLPEGGGQKFQPILLDDLAEGVASLVGETPQLGKAEEAEGVTLHAVGPEMMCLGEVIAAFRAWLGFGEARVIALPRFLLRPLLWIGDLASYFGNRSSFRSASLDQMDYFTEHDPGDFERLLNRPLKRLGEYLDAYPAEFADRQQARTIFLWPLLKWVMGLSFILTGLLSFSGLLNVLPLDAGVGVMDAFSGIDGLVSILAGGLFLSNKWMRIGGMLKIISLLVMGGAGLAHSVDGFSFFGGVLGVLLPVLTIGLVMGLNEPR